MSHYLNQTSKVILDKYKGDLDNLRKEAKHDPVKERELVKAFKVYMCVHGYIVLLPSHTVPLFPLSSGLTKAGSKLPVLSIFPCKRMYSNQNVTSFAGFCRGCNHVSGLRGAFVLDSSHTKACLAAHLSLLVAMLCSEFGKLAVCLCSSEGLKRPFLLTYDHNSHNGTVPCRDLAKWPSISSAGKPKKPGRSSSPLQMTELSNWQQNMACLTMQPNWHSWWIMTNTSLSGCWLR